jgi:hypothetical protein
MRSSMLLGRSLLLNIRGSWFKSLLSQEPFRLWTERKEKRSSKLTTPLCIQRAGVKPVGISFFSEYSTDKVYLFDCFETGPKLFSDGVRRSEGVIFD